MYKGQVLLLQYTILLYIALYIDNIIVVAFQYLDSLINNNKDIVLKLAYIQLIQLLASFKKIISKEQQNNYINPKNTYKSITIVINIYFNILR